MKEIWKKIADTNYYISNKGRVKNSNGYIKKQTKDARGYLRLQLYIDGKKINFRIHRLVAMAFLENPENKKTVNHIDGNKENNNVDNLEWATYSENQYHAIRTGLSPRVTPAKIRAAKNATLCRISKKGVV